MSFLKKNTMEYKYSTTLWRDKGVCGRKRGAVAEPEGRREVLWHKLMMTLLAILV